MFLAATPLGATDLRDVLTDYTLTSWRAGDGPPRGTIFALVQDPDGYLWLGSDAGLSRFDGSRFVDGTALLGPDLPNLPVRALSLSDDGTLWVGFGGRGGVARIVRVGGGKVQALELILENVDCGLVHAIASDQGTVWVAAQKGLHRAEGDTWELWTPGLSGEPVTAIHVDSRGSLHIAQAGQIYTRALGATAFIQAESSDSAGELVRGIAEDDRGSVWMTDPIAGLRQVGRRELISLEAGRGVRLLLDRAGRLWVGTAGQGLWRVRLAKGEGHLSIEKATGLTGLVGDGVYSLLEDRDGNIWAGTTEGLNRLTPRRFTQLVDVGLVAGVEATPDGRIWLATSRGLTLVQPSEGEGREPLLTSTAPVLALHAARDGALWVATDQQVVRYSKGKPASTLALPAAPRLAKIESIASLRDDLWLYDTDDGLHRWRDGRVERVSELARERIVAMQTDSKDRLWIMLEEGSVAIVTDQGTIARRGPADGLDAGPYHSLCEDSEGTIWLAGARGLSRFQGGRFATAEANDVFPAMNLVAVILDGRGQLWFGGSRGIFRMSVEEYDRLVSSREHRARYALYERADGIAGVALTSGSNRRVVRAIDGRLWFVTYRGITIVDPAAAEEPRLAGPMRIESIVADGRRVTLQERIALPARTRLVEIQYAAPDLTSAVKDRFRYRLEGFDTDWHDAGNRQLAFYTNLPPRQYRFVVTASRAGSWDRGDTTIDFAILPTFYQTNTFFIVLGLGAVAVVGSLWQMRLRRVRRQFAVLLNERARLSREVHDTLLQSLVGTALQLDALASDFESPETACKESLVRARRQVEEHIREARQAIWELRSPRLEHGDLPAALDEVAKRATEGRAVDCEISFSGSVRRMSPRIERQILRIGQEAMLNAVHHGRATHLDVRLEYQPSSLVLRVTDNGVGFDQTKLGEESERHYGLSMMKERANEIGGALEVSSTIGGGTTVTALIPSA